MCVLPEAAGGPCVASVLQRTMQNTGSGPLGRRNLQGRGWTGERPGNGEVRWL